MIVFVHQPEYIPWLGFFDKLARCDTYVIYDDAQYQHGGFHNRNRIRTLKSWEWLTVPISHGHPQTIRDVKISGDQWKNKHLNRICQLYEKSPYFKQFYPTIRDAIDLKHELLIGLDLHLIKAISELLDISAKMVRSSEFPYAGKEKNEKLVSMCKFLGADTYLCGSGGKCYVDEALFKGAKINVQWHSYQHPTYKQRFEGFQPYMSIIDLLFNEGPTAKEIILRGGVVEPSKPQEDPVLKQLMVEQAETTSVAV
jgi:hypothetical protein